MSFLRWVVRLQGIYSFKERILRLALLTAAHRFPPSHLPTLE
mgnify:CR=1 FL=1